MKGQVTKFIFMGDPQTSRISGRTNDYSRWKELLIKAARKAWGSQASQEEKILVLGGDLVNRVTDTEEWTAFFDALHGAEKELGLQPNELKLLTPTGNHSKLRSYSDLEVFEENVKLPANGPIGLERNFYSYNSGCVHFMILDSNLMGSRKKDACKYIGYWIKADLAVNRQPVTVAVMHHPVETVKTSFDDEFRASVMRDNYMDLMNRYGVDFILCGHQHLYSRSREMMAKGGTGITQIMGVSGTKYFKGQDLSQMECVKEFASTATIFETDGKTIKMETIDHEGNPIDSWSKPARPAQARDCGSCINFAECRGTGAFERRQAEEKARSLGNPVIPGRIGGLTVVGPDNKESFIDIESLQELPDYSESFSVLRRGQINLQEIRGKRLKELLALAGIEFKSQAEIKSLAILLLSARGDQKTIKASEAFGGKRYTGSDHVDSGCPVEPLVYLDEGQESAICFACGQTEPDEYNGRKWMEDLVEIQIIRGLDVGGTT